LTTGEYLSSQVKGLLEDTFKTKVTDIYACNEAGDIAWQCIKGQFYHINADNCIVEILKNGKPAEKDQTGEVVITNLNRYSMPFIRYKNGDLASFSGKECSCGCCLPVISEIIGRTGEDIMLPSGRIIPWNQLKGFMNHPDIRQFQIIQNKDGSLTVKFIAEEKNNIEDTKTLLASRFKGLLGDCVNIGFSIVERIEPAPSGKSRLVICEYHP
jgi:phenylacetate-CoA ligase